MGFATMAMLSNARRLGLRHQSRWRIYGMSSLLLVCAVVASLAVGVFAAQGLCVVMFKVFKMHAMQVAASRRIPEPQTVRLETSQS